MKQDLFYFIGVACTKTRKNSKLQEYSSICRNEVLGSHVFKINIYFINDAFNFLLSLVFEAEHTAELYSDL